MSEQGRSSHEASPAPSDLMDIDLPSEPIEEEDHDLDISASDAEVFLVKVPTFLADRWTKGHDFDEQGEQITGDELEVGEIIIPNLPDGTPDYTKITLQLHPRPSLPQNYTLPLQPAQNSEHIFSTSDSLHGLEVAGRVLKHGTLTPVIDKSYHSLMAARAKKVESKKREIQWVDVSGTSAQTYIKPVNSVPRSAFGSAALKKVDKEKKERIDKEDLKILLFNAFEQYAHWSFKGLVEHTKQPQVWLKDVLTEIAFLNKRGPYVGTWELKPEFKTRRPRTPNAAAEEMKVEGGDDNGSVDSLDDDLDDSQENLEETTMIE
ncbi:transcription initiation factor IIF, beta subunit-domain-containing protein [Gaertneriomyces semiglobifer]|nr:transcription initiation factor IIF, beta subunit-domain-containing protein [Gaertneriomyces semiglobifer]